MSDDLTNWAESFTYRARELHAPTSIMEAQELVARLPRVKALGTRHSFSTVADSPGGALVSLRGLEAKVEIDEVAQLATVTGAMTYGAVAQALESSGWALANMGSLPHISVAGATATATHGSGDSNGILSTSVRGLEIITADGNLRTITNDDPNLAALAVGVGAFGVITNVTLAIQPSYLVRQDVYTGAPWGTVLESFDEVMASAYSVNVLGNYGRPDVGAIIVKSVVTSAEPTDAPKHRFGGVWDDDPADGPDDHRTIRAGVPGPWSERLPHFRPDHPPSVGGDELQSEYFVPRRHGVAAIEALLRIGERIQPHLHASEIRTMAGDELWSSPAYGRDSVSIGFTWRKHPEEVAALTRAVETALEPYDPRPHWGKLFAMRDLRWRLPKLADFFELAERFDPRGKFRSEFLNSIH